MQCKVNVSIDDVSPHPRSGINVLKNCETLIKEFPDIKFSLFIPIAYWRTMKPGVSTTEPLVLSKYKDFCNILLSLPKENFELCYHGLYHGIPGKSDNDELRNLNYQDSLTLFSKMFSIVEESGLDKCFKRILRPPAWRMSSECIRASKDFGFDVLALIDLDYTKECYQGAEIEFGNVVNANCYPPFEPLKLYEKTEIVYHACDWDRNYLDDDKTNELIEFIEFNLDKIRFSFLGEML